MPLLTMLFLGAGFIVQLPTISAQETSAQGAEAQGASAQGAEAQGAEAQGAVPDFPIEEIQPSADGPGAGEDKLFFVDNAAGNAPVGEPSIWTVVRMVLTLALAAVAVYGVVFLVKRSSKQSVNKDPFLKILASTPLGSNRYAHVVAVGSKAWLLGSSDGGVNLIGEIDDKDVLNAMLLEESQKSAEAATGRFPDFLGMLRRLGVSAKPNAPGADDIRKRRERLKGL